MPFERDKSCLCIPNDCNSVRTSVLANRNTETTLVPLKRQLFTALFCQAQPKLQQSWAERALFPVDPATRPPIQPSAGKVDLAKGL